MTLPTFEGDLLIVNGLDPFFILPAQVYSFWQLLGEIQVHTNPGKGGIPLGLRLLRHLNKRAYGISNVPQGFQIPVFPWEGEEADLDWGHRHVLCFRVESFLPWTEIKAR